MIIVCQLSCGERYDSHASAGRYRIEFMSNLCRVSDSQTLSRGCQDAFR